MMNNQNYKNKKNYKNYKNYKNNNRIILIAKKVEKQSIKYKKQLSSCQNKLNRNKIKAAYMRPLSKYFQSTLTLCHCIEK